MYYKLTVYQNEDCNIKHIFSTADESATCLLQAQRIYKLLREKFPIKDGYQIQVVKWETRGIEMSDEMTESPF